MLNVYDLKLSHPDVFKQFSVGENLIVHYKCPQAEKLVELYNHFNAIYFTLSGKKSLNYRSKSWHLTDDEALLVTRGAYTQELFENMDWEVLAFHFNDDFLKRIYKEYLLNFKVESDLTLPDDQILTIQINPIIKSSFYSLLSYFQGKDAPSEYLLELKITELLINILADSKNKDIRAYFNFVDGQYKRSIRHIMERNFMYHLSLPEFAKLAQRSITAFKNDFKKYYKTTPGKWLMEKRLTYAKHLLETSDKNVTEIAYDSGFQNASHFSKSFKKAFAISPSQLRKKD